MSGNCYHEMTHFTAKTNEIQFRLALQKTRTVFWGQDKWNENGMGKRKQKKRTKGRLCLWRDTSQKWTNMMMMMTISIQCICMYAHSCKYYINSDPHMKTY